MKKHIYILFITILSITFLLTGCKKESKNHNKNKESNEEASDISENESKIDRSDESITITPDVTVNTAVPEINKKYKAPEELGEDLSKYIVEFDGHLYQLPAPISEFINNGFEINESGSDKTVNSRDNGWIELKKDGKILGAMVTNYADYETIIENCFITELSSDNSQSNFSIKLPRGITMERNHLDLEKMLKGIEYTIEESSLQSFYNIQDPNNVFRIISIVLNKEENKVIKIIVSNAVEYDDLFK